MTAPEIDFLFDALTNRKSDTLTIDHWSSKIFDDALNPLQLIREVIHVQEMNADDVLF